MMNTHTASPSDQVSLVDLTVLLVKRWKLMLTIFLVILLAGAAFALLRPAIYTYTSLYAIAETADEKGELTGLEAPEVLVLQLESVILPAQIRATLDKQSWERLPFTVEAEHLEGTHLIALATTAAQAHADDIKALHQKALSAIAEEQTTLLERMRAGLERRQAVIQKTLDFAGVDIDEHPELLGEIENELAMLKAGQIQQVATRSKQPQGMGIQPILAIAALLGLMLAVLSAFTCHFIHAVCQRHAHTSRKPPQEIQEGAY